jgi:hypothetical protein
MGQKNQFFGQKIFSFKNGFLSLLFIEFEEFLPF